MICIFAPPLYTVRKYPLKYLIDNNFNVQHTIDEDKPFNIKQQDNLLFRQIRLITGNNKPFNKYIIFIDCKGGKSFEEELKTLVIDGVKIRYQSFDFGERSASMTRNQILSYIDTKIINELNKRVTMDIDLPKTVLSKLYAYRGLLLSSCHCIENWYPKTIVVPDYYKTISNQKIKYVYDKESEFIDKEGNQRTWKQKDIAEDVRDIQINAFDGCGIHHPDISKIIKDKIHSKTDMTSILWRMPYIKGVTHEINYTEYFKERNIKYIVDVWGIPHSINEPMIILTESMYKGKKYFQKYKDYRDWDEYWKRFIKYDHCIGIAKWNFSTEEEPIYTRGNYQILQDLELSYDDFESLAQDSMDWVQKIVDGDDFYTYCFLGLVADRLKPVDSFAKAVLKNPEMLKEYCIRNHIIKLISKYIDEFKCGKLWLRSCYKFLVPDLIMLLNWIGNSKSDSVPEGCLSSDEFYSLGADGIYEGEYLIERNPHICKSEHVILKGVKKDIINKYCGHLTNICMINCNSITPQRLNGADYDGDLVLVVDNGVMMSGVDRNAPIVIDIDDKQTAKEEKISKENLVQLVLRTMNSLIGETSNCATAYHNKQPKSVEQKKKYESYIDLLSVINGKAIDYAKTGVLFNIPRNIAKYSKPLPYFMKYASEFYGKQSKFSKAYSNMNRLCFKIEKWEKSIRWKRTYKDFDYKIMIDESITVRDNMFNEIENIYLSYCDTMKALGKLKLKLSKYEEYKEDFKDVLICYVNQKPVIDWKRYFQMYKNTCEGICTNNQMLANIVVRLCYEKYPSRNTSKNFMWKVAEEGIIKNIQQVDLQLPQKDTGGDLYYLGKKYKIIDMKKEDIIID